MKALRIYLNPTADTFIDMGIADDFHMGAWLQAARKDGGAIAQFGFVPMTSIHHVLVVDAGQATTLTVFPGGKLN